MDIGISSTPINKPQFGTSDGIESTAEAYAFLSRVKPIETARHLMKGPVLPCEGENEIIVPPRPLFTSRHAPGRLFLNVDALSMTSLLAPEHHLGQETGKLLNRSMDEFCYYFVSLVSQRIKRWNHEHPDQAVSAKERKKLIRLTHAMLDNRKLMKGLAEIGNDLRQVYQEKYGESLPELSIKTGAMPFSKYKQADTEANVRRCDPVNGQASGRHSTAFDNIVHAEIIPKQVIRYPFRLNTRDAVPTGRCRELLDDYIASTLASIHWDRPDIFLGFIPSDIADDEVKKHGFLDSLSGGNLAHGEYSHALQMCLAIKAGLLDHELLERVIDLKLWNIIFDGGAMTSYIFSTSEVLTHSLRDELETHFGTATSKATAIKVCNPNQTILSRSPVAINMILLNAELSRALRANLSSNMPELEKKRMVQRWAGPHQFERTEDIHRGLRALESVITRTQLETQDMLAQSPSLEHLQLTRGEDMFRIKGGLTGQFSMNMRKNLKQEEVARHLQAGKSQVFAIEVEEEDGKKSNRWIPIKSPADALNYKTFIVKAEPA